MSTLDVALALGSNLPSTAVVEGEGEPRERAFDFALAELEAGGCRLLARSRWIETEPVDVPDEQPPYLNGCVLVETERSLGELSRTRAQPARLGATIAAAA